MFVVYALPRSRTAWLSVFLTYGIVVCHHESASFMRKIEDLPALLTRPNTGTVETSASYGHALVRHYAPKAKIVVVKRDVDQVVNSTLKLSQGLAVYDEEKLRRNMQYGARTLNAIAAEPGVLSLQYEDLATESGARQIFEHCLPYEFDRGHWLALKEQNLQVDFKAFLAYHMANRTEIFNFKDQCKARLRALVRAGAIRKERAYA
jgi:hypothetical protein